jgi:hypothetical protein
VIHWWQCWCIRRGKQGFAIGRACSLQTYKWGCTPGVVPSWKTICSSPNIALFSWWGTVDCGWEVVEGVLGRALGAPQQAGLSFWPFARKLAVEAPFLPFNCGIWEKRT